MSINLQKGQKVDLTKGRPELKKLVLGLGWDASDSEGKTFDLDASALLLNKDSKVSKESDFVFFRNTQDSLGSVIHTGDNLTGDGDGDDEQIKVDLSKVDASVEKITLVVNIYDAVNKRQNFGQVSNAYIRILNEDTSEELIRYDLSEDFSTETSVIFGEVYRNNGEWKFNAVGNGKNAELKELIKEYGL